MEIWNNITNFWPLGSAKESNVMLTKKSEEKTMKFISEKTKTFKLFNALINGEAVTPARAMHDFGIKNIAAEASRIRQAGYAVYANSRRAGNNVKVTEYVIGKPSRKLVAAGYRALAMGL